ncbi:MAG: ketopantoate reductase family protein [Archangiaceae bacterium]|nr:ketopantoate reductase family protein [Archangiaceae bacterium]
MKIAIYGAGRIGTMFAFHLAQAGHDLTLIARGSRLDELSRSPVIEMVDGRKANVNVSGELDPATPWDLVLVTTLAHQVDATLPALKACAAKKVMFMFNTVESLEKLRAAVGASRFEISFPTVIAFLENGKLRGTVNGPGNGTTTTSAEWAAIFNAAKIPTEVVPDMESFLRSHAALVIPMMAIGNTVSARGRALSFSEALRYASMLDEAFAIVRSLGNAITPGFVVVLSKLPAVLVACVFWAASRAAAVTDLGKMGPAEVRALIDGFVQLAPGQSAHLKALRP